MRHLDDRTTFATLAKHTLDRMTQNTVLLKPAVILRQLVQLARWFGWGDGHAAHTHTRLAHACAESKEEPRHITWYMHVWHVVQIFLHAGVLNGPWRVQSTSQTVYVEFPVMEAGALAVRVAFSSHHNHCHVELQGR